MEWYDIEVDGRHTVNVPPLLSPTTLSPNPNGEEDNAVGKKWGGIIHKGEWAWLSKDSMLQIVSLRNGQTISTYEFCEARGYDSCCIKCVEEVYPNNPEIMLLAVVLESFRGPGGGGSFVVLYSVEFSSVLSAIELSLHITCARFMDVTACNGTLLQNFDGCLAIGSEEGVVVLLNLDIRKIYPHQPELEDAAFVPCHIVDYSVQLIDIHRNFRQCRQDGVHFGLQLEVIESPCSIQCIQAIDLIMGLAIGLEDGRLALYDLTELQIFYVALPKPEIAMSPLVKMDYLEPPDDPRPCLYIWTLHENGENLHAVMHNLMYEKRVLDEHSEVEGRYYFESFQTGAVRLQLPLEATKSEALACQTISTLSSHGEDDSNCLCAISWFSALELKNKLLIFDLNQWYKEEMPSALEYGKQPNYLAGYILNGECNGLHTQLQPNTITHFNSMQRFEEHFYPNSLSFDCSLLHTDGCRRYNWEGAQNRLINMLRVSNASVFLEPNNCFNEILRTRLMPQFIELNFNSTFSKNAKYEIMLSTALEHNCVSLLRDCAKSWIDGSFMGDFAVSTGLSLSTITDWIWKRAMDIKSRCNDLCKGLFEFGGYPLDHREQKELGFITRQLKLLYDLLGDILVYAKKQVPERVYSSLENNYNSLHMASNYQDILLWLLNIGLLPEASPYNAQVNASHDLVPYPYKELKEMYKKKRSYFGKINNNFISKKSGSCRLLYIDAFIDHACKGSVLHEYWLENDGDGIYPPNSIEAMLRVMLVPELEYENKYAILLYFFLDLNMAIDEDAYKGVVANFIKFPSVFKLSAALIKTVQSFWNLDHDQFLPAVDEFISPFNKNQCYPQWLVELLIEALLTQNAANLALRILESQPSLISPMLKLKTLLANELLSEAFHFVRSKHDDSLLEIFFTSCLRNGQFGVIRDLALSESEGMILQNILKRSKAPDAESLHFVYLLQKSKYIEAVSYMDELSTKSKSLRSSLHHQHPTNMETPNMVLSAFNTTMTPVTQGLTDVYFRIKNKIKQKDVDNKSPVPLSCQLIKQNANSLLGGIYHSSALSAHFATYYWGEMEEEQGRNDAKRLLSSNNAPFLRRPQIETNYVDLIGRNNLSYPQTYKITEKRNLVESEVLDTAEDQVERQKLENQMNPKKKRRLFGKEIVDDLTQFMRMNKEKSITLNANDFKFNEAPPPSPVEDKTITSMEILTRPLLTKPPNRSHEEPQSVQPEIQGILKTNITEQGQHAQRDGPPPYEEEKNLRFRLPSTDLNNSQNRSQYEEVDEMDTLEQNNVEAPQPKQLSTVLEYSIRSKQIARSVSEESNKSAVSSSNTSEENFYSPLSSQNNSKLDCSNLSRSSFLGGPKPRKPIARLSSEREQEAQISTRLIARLSAEGDSQEKTRQMAKERDSQEKSRQIDRLSAERKSQEKVRQTDRLSAERESQEKSITTARCSAEMESQEKALKSVTPTIQGVAQVKDESVGNISSEHETSMGIVSGEPTKGTTPSKESTISSFATALGTTALRISGRKSLEMVSEENDLSENVTDKESSNLAYATAFDTVTYKTDTGISQFSSGFGSISGRTTLAGSKISEFLPKVSSSKVGSTPLKSEETTEVKPPSPAKLSECSTVLGSLTTFDCTSGGSQNIFAIPSLPTEKSKPEPTEKHTEEQKRQMLDTTLGMSTYDFSVLDSTHLQQTKSSLMVTARDVETSEKEDKEEKNEKSDENKMETKAAGDEKVECVDDESQVAEPETNKEKEVESVISNENEHETPSKKGWADLIYHSDDSLIVLSSSSSYIDDNDYGRAFDFRDSDDEKSPRKGDHGDIDSEQSFDTGEYDDYNEDVDGEDEGEGGLEGEEDSSDNLDNCADTESSDVIEVTDESSADMQLNTSSQDEESSNEGVMENGSSSSTTTTRSESSKGHVADQGVVSTTTTNSSETVSSVCEADTLVTSTGKTDEVTSTICAPSEVEIQVNENITTSTTDISEQPSAQKEQSDSVTDSAVVSTDQISENELTSHSNENVQGSKQLQQALSEDQQEEDKLSVKEVVKKEVGETAKTLESLEEEQITLRMEDGDSIDAMDSEKTRDNNMADEKVDKDKTAKIQVSKIDQLSIGNESKGSADTLADTKSKSQDNKPNETSKAKSTAESAASAITSTGKIVRLRTGSKTPVDLELVSNAISSPRRNTRGSSVPPSYLDSEVVSSPRGTTRGTSVPPVDLETKSIAVSSPRRNIRATSVQPADVESTTAERRRTRGISVPPQAVTESEEVGTTPSRRRSLRASSLQPKYKLEDETEAPGTPNKREKIEGSETPNLNSRSTRGSSVPPGVLTGKVSTRRRSIMLDAINEDTTVLESPSANTRYRSRVNSMESELDSSLISTDQPTQSKRSRRVSLSDTAGDLPLTPKRTRRNSINSQPETTVLTPRTLRGRSILSVPEDESEGVQALTKPSDTRKVGVKRKVSTDEHPTESTEKIKEIDDENPSSSKKHHSPKSDVSDTSSALYSTSRRLTRTQLAMMEKSAALTQSANIDSSQPNNKGTTKRRPPKAHTNVSHDSDDAESVSSKRSTASSTTATKRRSTRKATKDKEDHEDDVASVASSLGSEHNLRGRRSKDKGSPNSILSAIPEDEPVETKKRSRTSAKH